jgi:O-antigen ligase
MPNGELIATTPRLQGERMPLVLIGAVVLLFAIANVFADTLVATAALLGVVAAMAIASRPDFAVTLLLGSFLVTYPWWLQGRGFLTLNNVVGAWLAVVMLYRIYRSGDWSFLRNREFQLLAAIAAVFLLSRYLNRPDDHTMALVEPLLTHTQDPARIIVNRLVFFVFLIYFIRTPQQIRWIFLLTVSLAVLSGFAAIWMVVAGGGFAGYRARSGMFIAAAGNPNRLALTAIIGIVTLWYLMQWLRNSFASVVISAVMAGLVLAVFMTGSRSGVVALGLMALILGYEGGLTARKLVLGALAILFAAVLVIQVAPEQALERASSLPGTGAAQSDLGAGSVERRGYTAGLALDFARRNPLIGIGIGNWEITRYLSDDTRNITPPHSAVLMALAEGGIITLGLYVVVLLHTLRNFLDVASHLNGPENRGMMQWIAKTMRASFLVFLAMSLVGDLWLSIFFYWFVGIASVMARWVFEPVEEEAIEENRALAGAAA